MYATRLRYGRSASLVLPETPPPRPPRRTDLATSTPTLALVCILLACSLTLALASKLTILASDFVDFDLVERMAVAVEEVEDGDEV